MDIQLPSIKSLEEEYLRKKKQVEEELLKEYSDKIKRIVSMFLEYEEQHYYGSLGFKFENGNIVYVKKEETIKL